MEKMQSAKEGIVYKIGFGMFLFFNRGASMRITVAIKVREYFNTCVEFILVATPRNAAANANPPPVLPRYDAVKNPIANGFIPKNVALATIKPII